MKARPAWLFPYHTFLFGIFSVLALYQANVSEVSIVRVLRPAVVAFALAALLLVVFRWITRDIMRAGLIVTACMLAFFCYGHAAGCVQTSDAGYLREYTRQRYLFAVWLALFAVGVILAGAQSRLRTTTLFLNMLSTVLILVSTTAVVQQRVSGAADTRAMDIWRREVALETKQAGLHPTKPLRDVYYIILDAYSRGDVLDRCFGHDNSDFLRALRSRGFYIAERSSSNYNYTYGSLASSLNMDYVQSLINTTGGRPVPRVLSEMIRQSRVIRYLKSLGYEFVLFPGTYPPTGYNPNADRLVSNEMVWISEFERTLLSYSALQAFFQTDHMQRGRALNTLCRLDRVGDPGRPVLTFAHVMCPHKPFVFDAKGRWPRREDKSPEWRLYSDQVRFVNQQVLRIVDRIIKHSDVPPIIIIQGDHATRSAPRPPYQKATSCDLSSLGAGPGTEILSAYYLPDGGDRLLYESVSPVNTFRVVFNKYFGAHYELLPDRSYFVSLPKGSGTAHYSPIRELSWAVKQGRNVPAGAQKIRPNVRSRSVPWQSTD